MRPRGHSFLEESLGHPRIRRTLMRALVGDPLTFTPHDIVALERLRAASRDTRRFTQDDYESQGLSYQAQLERDAVATTESDSDELFQPGWEWNQRARALGGVDTGCVGGEREYGNACWDINR